MFKFKVFLHSILALVIYLVSTVCLGNQHSDLLISNFYDKDVGIAFSMLSKKDWESPGNQHFHNTPSNGQKVVQALAITNASKQIWPYPADSRFGLVFSIAENSNFYQYFATKSRLSTACTVNNAKFKSPIKHAPANQYANITNWAIACNDNKEVAFCGRCTDGGVCAGSGNMPATSNELWSAIGKQVSYTEFNKAKNAIVSITGTSNCRWNTTPNIWNEFNTNGLSPSALRGVIIDAITPCKSGLINAEAVIFPCNNTTTNSLNNDRAWVPTSATLCNYLNKVNSTRNEWPLYKLLSAGKQSGKSTLKKVDSVKCL
jgi:hypothetical protein